jgi:hypothetical protein
MANRGGVGVGMGVYVMQLSEIDNDIIMSTPVCTFAMPPTHDIDGRIARSLSGHASAPSSSTPQGHFYFFPSPLYVYDNKRKRHQHNTIPILHLITINIFRAPTASPRDSVADPCSRGPAVFWRGHDPEHGSQTMALRRWPSATYTRLWPIEP